MLVAYQKADAKPGQRACEGCRYIADRPPAIPAEAPPVTGCVHRSDEPEPIPANCGCQAVKTLDLYQCHLIDDACAVTTLDVERLAETFARAGVKRSMADCSRCPHRAAVGERPRNLHAITSFFNPADSWRMRDNYQRFKAALPIPLHTVELLFPGQETVDPDAFHILGDREKHTLWQKERLLNIALARLPEDVDAVAWIDADILFPGDAWVEQTLDMLADYHVGQLCALTDFMAEDESVLETFTGCAYAAASRAKQRGAPGYAWAARREFLDSIGGLFEWEAAAGGGDVWMARAFLGGDVDSLPEWLAPTPGLITRYQMWAKPVRQLTAGRVGYLPITVRHLYHGSKANRRYEERCQHRHGYDPFTDLTTGETGLLAWTGNNAPLEQFTRGYFAARKPDE